MTAPEVIVSTLIGHRDVGTGLLCLGSLARHSCEPVRFQLHDDGSLTEEDKARLSSQLPVHGFISRDHANAVVNERLSRYPYCAQFRNRYIYGLKLFDAPIFAEGDSLAFCDTDIFFLRPFRGLFTWPDEQTGCLFMQDYQNAYSFRPWHLASSSKFQVPPRLNCGLFSFRLRYHDLDYLEWLLKRYDKLFEARYHWVEQTCWAVLASRCGGRFWSERQICVIRGESCLTDDLIGAHLVTPVRGLLPEAAARSRSDCEPVEILSEPMKRLNSMQLFREQAGQFFQRKFAHAK